VNNGLAYDMLGADFALLCRAVGEGKPKLHESETNAQLKVARQGEDEVCRQLPGEKVRRKLLAGSWQQLAWQLRCEELAWTGCAKQPAHLWPAPSQQSMLHCCWTDAVHADLCQQLPEQLQSLVWPALHAKVSLFDLFIDR